MSKGLISLKANTDWGCISSRLKASGERQQDCVSQVKRMHECVGNGRKFVKPLSVLGQCYGAEVHYLNSSKHRKLIELR